MITRRSAIKTITFAAGAAAVSSPLLHAQPAEVFKLPPLGYDYDVLEPHIDAETMKIHHGKHHAAYVAKLNQAVAAAPALAKKPIEDLLANIDSAPEAVRKDLRNQGGGHYNHTLFWQMMKKGGEGKPGGALGKALEQSFGGMEKFQEKFSDAAAKVFGSGWAWLVWREGKLAIESTPNQDNPIMTGGQPLLGLDVWEHAYYLKYQNRRPEYVKAFYNVVNWDFVSERFTQVSKG